MSGKKFKTEIIGSALSHKGLYVGSTNHVVNVQLLAVCGTTGKTLGFNYINNNLSQCIEDRWTTVFSEWSRDITLAFFSSQAGLHCLCSKHLRAPGGPTWKNLFGGLLIIKMFGNNSFRTRAILSLKELLIIHKRIITLSHLFIKITFSCELSTVLQKRQDDIKCITVNLEQQYLVWFHLLLYNLSAVGKSNFSEPHGS